MLMQPLYELPTGRAIRLTDVTGIDATIAVKNNPIVRVDISRSEWAVVKFSDCPSAIAWAAEFRAAVNAARAEAAAEAVDHATLLPHILDISQAVARISICVALLLDYADADPTAALKATLNAALLDPARAPPHPVEPEQPPC